MYLSFFDEMFTSPKDRAKSIIMKATKYRLPIVFSMDAIKSYEPCKRTGTTMLNILNILELNIFPRLYCFLARPKNTPINTPKQACPGIAVIALTIAVEIPYDKT